MKINKDKNINIDGAKLKIAIILPYFNDSLGLELLNSAKNELLKNNVQEKSIEIIRTAGALEIPFACQKIIKHKKPDAIIALGVIIRGQTIHFELVANEAYRGIMDVQLKHGIPISFGIIAVENVKQAKERINKGKEAAQAVLIQTNI